MVRVNRILVFLIAFCIWLNAKGQVSFSINETFDQTPLNLALSTLSERYNLIFAYDDEQISPHFVSVDLDNLSLQEALDVLLRETNLEYRILKNNRVILKPSTPRSVESVNKSGNQRKQTLYLHGKVYNSENGNPLQYASVYFAINQQGINTDVNGYFKLPYPSLKDSLIISYLGFERLAFAVSDISPGELLKIQLAPKEHSLNDVVISDGTKQTVKISDGASEIVLNPQKISSLSPMGEPDVLRALQTLPGVSSNNESASELNIRGGLPDQNLILFDGITIYQPGHFYGAFSAFNANATKDVQLFRGGFSARYGGKASAVLDITGKPGNPQSLTGGISLNLMNINGYVETPLFNKKGALLIAGRRSFSDIVQSNFYNNLFDNIFQHGYIFTQRNRSAYDSLDINTDPNFLFDDINAKFTYQLSDKDLLSVSTYQGRDLLSYESKEVISSSMNILETSDTLILQNRGISAGWSRQWTSNLYSKTMLVYSDFNQAHVYRFASIDSNGEGSWLQSPRTNNLISLSLRQDNEWQINAKHKLLFGGEITDYKLAYRKRIFFDTVSGGGDTTARESRLFAAYAEEVFTPTDNISISIGGRYHYYNRTDKHYFEPRVSIKSNLTEKLRFKAAWSQHNQFTSSINQFNGLGVGESFWAIAGVAGSDSIPVVWSEHFITGFAYETDGFLLDIELYHKKTNGLTSYSYQTAEDLNNDVDLFNARLITGGESVARGLDIFIQKKTGKYTGWLAYSLSKVDVSFPEINQNNPFPAAHDSRHQLNLVNILSLDNWEFSLNWSYASGKPYTDIVEQTTARTPNQDPEPIFSPGERNANRLPAYHRLDMNITYHFTPKMELWKSKVGISAFNLYNRKNVRDFRYTVVTDPKRNQSELVSMSRNLLGFTPTVFLNIEF